MENIQAKYNLLDAASKKEVNDFIDFMLSKMAYSHQKLSDYKKKILSVSVWTDEEIKSIGEHEPFNFKPEEW